VGKEFLGKGWRYPVEPEEQDGKDKLCYSSEEEKIKQSILVILGTSRGERVMRPDFGSRLHELLFSPCSAATKGRVAQYVKEALVNWEPRIELLDVSVTADNSQKATLLVNIKYKVRPTNNVFNLVYPFYLQEGTVESP
jgi:phage baseplate assembly protein W